MCGRVHAWVCACGCVCMCVCVCVWVWVHAGEHMHVYEHTIGPALYTCAGMQVVS